jgi:hypothetical protein
MRLLDFFSLLVRRPGEAYGRLEGVIDSRLERFWVSAPQYEVDRLEHVVRKVEQTLQIDLSSHLHDSGLTEIQNHVREGIERLPENAPFPRILNGDFALARLCYSLCRAIRPAQVLETGVCYGVTTAFVLKAMERNETGVLHSIDLPPLGSDADEFVGVFVPETLQSRWQLHRGATKSVLPRLLDRIGPLDFFIHDSLHTYRNMKRELRTVTPSLLRPAVVVSDDIEGNPAFAEWAESLRPEYWAALQEDSKASLVGMAVLASHRSVPAHS